MIPNIGPRGQQQRLRFGVAGFGVAVVLGMALLMLGAPRAWHALVFVPLWLGAVGVFQAQGKT